MSSVEAGNDIVNRLVDVELFTTENVDEGMSPRGKSVNANVALGDYYEAAYTPLRRVFVRLVNESVGWGNLVHAYHVWKLV